MPDFRPDELTLMCLYNPGSRKELIGALNEMLPYLDADQDILRDMAQAVMKKLNRMTDTQFTAFCAKLEPTF